jgi:disulfide bond formation protein DsbB
VTKDQVSLFLALLAVIAELAVVIALVLAIGGLFSKRLARARAAAAAAVGPQALALAFAVAAVSMLGSLYFSEIAHFLPCRLCWYQRICMYPLVPMLGIAAWRRDIAVRPYAAVLAVIGVPISSYHVILEHFPNLETSACDLDNPCSLIWVRRFGYVTIPAMALSGFLLILMLLAVARTGPDPDTDTNSTSATGAEHQPS